MDDVVMNGVATQVHRCLVRFGFVQDEVEDGVDAFTRIMRAVGVNDETSVEDAEAAFAAQCLDVQRLSAAAVVLRDADEMQRKLADVHACIASCRTAFFASRFVDRVVRGMDHGLGVSQDQPPASTHDVKVLREWCMRGFTLEGLATDKQQILRPILTRTGLNSRSYKAIGTIEEVVYGCLTNDVSPAMHDLAIKAGNYIAVAKTIRDIRDVRLPVVVPTAGVYSFANGVLDGRNPLAVTFMPYEHAPAGLTATKFWPDHDFDPRWLDVEDFFTIPTPALSSIFEFQDVPEDAQRFVFAMLGRMLFPLGTHDSWQVMPFFLGTAGTGKSCICEHVIAQLFNPHDVAIISDACQTTFALGSAYDKRVFIIPEVTAKFNLPQSDWQQIVSGGNVEVRIKHQPSKYLLWSAPGICAGNVLPTCYTNNSGSLERRLVVVRFANQIPANRQDPDLPAKLAAELPMILLKLMGAYSWSLSTFVGAGLRMYMPDWLKGILQDVSRSFNVLESFLNSDSIVFGRHHFMPYKTFLEEIRMYAQLNGIPPPRITSDFLEAPMRNHGLTVQVVPETLMYAGGLSILRGERIVTGCDLLRNVPAE